MNKNLNSLSKQQQAIWINQQIYFKSSIYNVGGYFEFIGTIDEERLMSSIEQASNSLDIYDITASFLQYNDLLDSAFKPFKVSLKKGTKSVLTFYEWFQKPINLSLCIGEMQVYRKDENTVLAFGKFHHIIFDGFSLKLFLDKIIRFYNENNADEEKFLYQNFIEDEKKYSNSEEFKIDQFYWKEKLKDIDSSHKGFSSLLNTNASNKNLKSGRKEIAIPQKLFHEIKLFCKENNVTPFHYFITIIFVLNKKYNSPNFILGLPVFNRRNKYFKQTIGIFADMIPFRIKVNSNETFQSLIKKVSLNLRQDYRHQKLSMFDINQIARQNITPNVFFSYEKIIYKSKINNTSVKINYLNSGEQVQDLGVKLQEYSNKEDLTLNLEYRKSSFSSSQIDLLSKHLSNLIVNCKELSKLPISKIPYLSKKEKYQLLVDFNDTVADYPKNKTIIQLFEEQVERTPENIAVVFEETELTYREINERANQLGDYLRKTYYVQPDDLVAIMLNRSDWMIVAILSVLKSGGAYVPVDPEYPQDRIDYMLEDSNAKVLIDKKELDKFITNQNDYSKTNLEIITKPSHLAYVIYTSGSSGKPKGTLLENKNVVQLLKNDKELFNFNSTDVWTMFHSYCFDFSVWETYGALLFGGKLILVDSFAAKDPKLFLELLENHSVTVLNQTPSAFYNLIKEDFDYNSLGLRYIIFGGEKLSPLKLANWSKKYPQIKLVNMYGITETTVHVTYREVNSEDIKDNISNVGKPIATLKSYILNSNQNLLPVGVVGEICIAGDGLARGYLNRPELTAKKFVSNPFEEGERMYKTGDLGRWLPDGNIEFIGREDDQVKIRGYRIELSEIASALHQRDDIQECVVLAKKSEAGDKHLIAYLISNEELNISDLRSYLKESLPSYMIPNYFIQLEEFPLTSNSKLDKKALSNLKGIELSSGVEYVAPSTELEKQLVEIWSEVLGIEEDKIGMHDDFFALGGDSLNAVIIINEISEKIEKDIYLKDLYSNSNIHDLSQILEQQQREHLELIEVFFESKNHKQGFILCPYAGSLLGAYHPFAKELSKIANVYIISHPWHHQNLETSITELFKFKDILLEEFRDKVPNQNVYVLGASSGTSLSMFLSYELLKLNYSVKGIFQCAQPFQKVDNRDIEDVYEVINKDEIIIMKFLRKMLYNDEFNFSAYNIDVFKNDLRLSYNILEEIFKYPKLKIPIHCIFGEDDEFTKEKNYASLANSWKHFSDLVRYSTIPKAGHLFVNHNIDETVKILKNQVEEWNNEVGR